MVQPARLEGKEALLSFFPLCFSPTTMPPVRHEKPAIKLLAPGPEAPAPSPVPTPASIPVLVTLPNNKLFQKFMRTFIEKA